MITFTVYHWLIIKILSVIILLKAELFITKIYVCVYVHVLWLSVHTVFTNIATVYTCSIRCIRDYFCSTLNSSKWCFTVDIRCDDLSAPANGSIISCSSGRVGVGYEGDTCSFICNTGYELTGNETWTCQSNGRWNDTNVMCRRGRYIIMHYDLCIATYFVTMHSNVAQNPEVAIYTNKSNNL